mmetsp:Transcript_10736/g.27149  ORF Transcript_10736/g.27149 Transcript_10736/m.27149 type:complete len:364 (-) Transcript_10736:31-1122(-)|eukprot:CAMPEP_0174237704 /NCGR_PEP_ID=MMETSP0417-20130205/9211_1 /TAXON_ID=242541 /ORGANISM="Mayorella sp, Strain BSH-02190019" /LENGTH=363 /DNA_ID=CAMNT_0015316489 /DNA_START=92 /DNA_END=1183 /DNA_ORIENTATION=+
MPKSTLLQSEAILIALTMMAALAVPLQAVARQGDYCPLYGKLTPAQPSNNTQLGHWQFTSVLACSAALGLDTGFFNVSDRYDADLIGGPILDMGNAKFASVATSSVSGPIAGRVETECPQFTDTHSGLCTSAVLASLPADEVPVALVGTNQGVLYGVLSEGLRTQVQLYDPSGEGERLVFDSAHVQLQPPYLLLPFEVAPGLTSLLALYNGANESSAESGAPLHVTLMLLDKGNAAVELQMKLAGPLLGAAVNGSEVLVFLQRDVVWIYRLQLELGGKTHLVPVGSTGERVPHPFFRTYGPPFHVHGDFVYWGGFDGSGIGQEIALFRTDLRTMFTQELELNPNLPPPGRFFDQFVGPLPGGV